MDKLEKFEIEPLEVKKIPFQDHTIKVRSLKLTEQIYLIEQYINSYFYPEKNLTPNSDYDFFGAELELALGLIDLCSNVPVMVNGEGIYSADDLVDSGLFKAIQNAIPNYQEFRAQLERVIADIKEQKALRKSVGNVIDEAVAKLIETLNGIVDLSQDQQGIEKINQGLKELSETLKDSPINGLIEESQKAPRRKNARKVKENPK